MSFMLYTRFTFQDAHKYNYSSQTLINGPHTKFRHINLILLGSLILLQLEHRHPADLTCLALFCAYRRIFLF